MTSRVRIPGQVHQPSQMDGHICCMCIFNREAELAHSYDLSDQHF